MAIDDDPTVTADLTDVNVKLVTGDKTITFSNQLASANIIEIGNVTGISSLIFTICVSITISVCLFVAPPPPLPYQNIYRWVRAILL